MSLKDWVLGYIKKLGYVSVPVRYITTLIHEEGYEDPIKTHDEEILYVTHRVYNGFNGYFCWFAGKGYDFRIDREQNEVNSYFYFTLWGNGNWYESLKARYPVLLKECSGCNCSCYNDYLVTGWCTGKIPGVGVRIIL